MNAQQKKQLATAAKMAVLGKLADGIAHNINNVLAVISGNLQLMTELFGQSIPDDMGSMVDDAISAADLGAELTAQMTALSRVWVGSSRSCDLNEFVEGFSTLIKLAVGRGVSVETSLADHPEKVRVDQRELGIALLHLVMNAQEAMSGRGTLTIRVGCAKWQHRLVDDAAPGTPVHCAIVDIADTGCGMSSAIVAKAANAFFTTKSVDAGSGLGLTMVTDFVRSSDGELRIDSTPGAGTIVSICLPLEHAERRQ